MKYIIGENREQMLLFTTSLDDVISKDNEVRVIDAFVDSLPLDEFGFKKDFVENGRPGYHPADLLKLYIYGYMNKTRSSRDLEKECKRNVEVMWLLKKLTPDHNTISNFRRDNPEAIRKVFRATVQIAKNFNLIGGKLLAGDSTKMRAQNSKKNNYNQKKVNRHLDHIDKKLAEYSNKLANEDGDKQEIESEIKKQQERRRKYENIQKQLDDTGEIQISTADPDSRQLITRNNITEVGYNIQATSDAEHNLPIDYNVTNQNDSKAMGEMVTRAAEIVENTSFTALYDKGYHTGSEIKIAQELGVETIVDIPALPSSSSAPDPNYNLSEFKYNKEQDYYACPKGQNLTTNGNLYSKHYRNSVIKVKHYKTTACKDCPEITKCTKIKRGRVIERSEFASYIEQNKANLIAKQKLYRRRQAIIEHPFGTIKRQWGFYYISTKKGIKRAESEVGLIFTVYNLRRIINIIGFDKFRKHLISVFTYFDHIWLILSRFKLLKIFQNSITPVKLLSISPLKSNYFIQKAGIF